MTDSAIARAAYEAGTDPVDWAVTLAETQIDASAVILATRQWKPDAYPLFRGELTPGAIARRIIGDLLDAGWTPPAAPGRCGQCGNDPEPGRCCPECGRAAP